MMSGMNTMMWRCQDLLHKKPQVVPGTLLTLAGGLICYRHMTYKTFGRDEDVLKTFLAMVLVQMLPLVALEMKIMSCADPVGLFCKFAMPVTLIHAFFLGQRLVSYDQYDEETLYMSAVGFVWAFVTMVRGYRQTLMGFICCYQVWSLIALTVFAAFATDAVDEYMNPRNYYIATHHWVQEILKTSNSYIELTAFVPAVLMVYREDKNQTRYEIESTDTKRVSTAFFVFLISFYMMEDVMNAYFSYDFSVLASMAHLAHFALVVDFAFYVLAHIYNPDKLVGELRRWLPVDFTHEV